MPASLASLAYCWLHHQEEVGEGERTKESLIVERVCVRDEE